MKLPEWFSWRQNTIIVMGAIAGVLIARKIILNYFDANLSIGMFIGPLVGALIGAALGSFIKYRRTDQATIDELNKTVIDNAMIHGFLAYTAILTYQIFSRTNIFSSAEQVIIASSVMVVSLIYQGLRFNEKLGELV